MNTHKHNYQQWIFLSFIDGVDPASVFEKTSKNCQTAFQTHPYANCILYTDEDCTSDDPSETMPINRAISFVSLGLLRNKVEGISVRKGCTLRLWKSKLKGILFSITYRGLF